MQQALLAANVPTELHVYPGAFHGSANMAAERRDLKALEDETNSQRSTARSMERDGLTQPKISPTHQQDTPARHAS